MYAFSFRMTSTNRLRCCFFSHRRAIIITWYIRLKNQIIHISPSHSSRRSSRNLSSVLKNWLIEKLFFLTSYFTFTFALYSRRVAIKKKKKKLGQPVPHIFLYVAFVLFASQPKVYILQCCKYNKTYCFKSYAFSGST